jgi:hypothetical protein
MMRYRASKLDCEGCSLKPQCCPNAPARKILRSIHEGARDMARDLAGTEAYATSRRERKKIEMLFAHLNAFTPYKQLWKVLLTVWQKFTVILLETHTLPGQSFNAVRKCRRT